LRVGIDWQNPSGRFSSFGAEDEYFLKASNHLPAKPPKCPSPPWYHSNGEEAEPHGNATDSAEIGFVSQIAQAAVCPTSAGLLGPARCLPDLASFAKFSAGRACELFCRLASFRRVL